MKNKSIIIVVGIIVLVIAISILSSNTPTKIQLGQYKGIKIMDSKTTVSNKDVENALIDAVMSKQEEVKIKDRAVRKGDKANIDFAGKVDGVLFDGGSAKGYDLVIGSGSFIPGFEDQVVGMKTGQTKDIKVTFPDPYTANTDLSGKKAVFTVKVNSIHGKIVPDKITDAMIKKISDTHLTVKKMRKQQIKTIKRHKSGRL